MGDSSDDDTDRKLIRRGEHLKSRGRRLHRSRTQSPDGTKSDSSMINHLSGDECEAQTGWGDHTLHNYKSSRSMGSNTGVFGDDDDDDDDDDEGCSDNCLRQEFLGPSRRGNHSYRSVVPIPTKSSSIKQGIFTSMQSNPSTNETDTDIECNIRTTQLMEAADIPTNLLVYKSPAKSEEVSQRLEFEEQLNGSYRDENEIGNNQITPAPYKAYTLSLSDSSEEPFLETTSHTATSTSSIPPYKPPPVELFVSTKTKRQQSSRRIFTERITDPFHQFALFALPQDLVLRRLHDDRMLQDDGPRYLDAFLYHHVKAVDTYPTSPSNIDLPGLSAFCVPNGLKVRFLPRAGMEGAMRIGTVGPNGDNCHFLVFTNGVGACDHGVAITIKSEVVLAKGDRMRLTSILAERRRRRSAATKIARWYKRKLRYRNLIEALQLAGLEELAVEDLNAALTSGEVRMIAKMLRPQETKRRSSRRSARYAGDKLQRSSTPSNRHSKGGIQRKLQSMLNRREIRGATIAPRTRTRRSEAATLEVASVTRNAMRRFGSLPLLQHSSDEDDNSEKRTGLRRLLLNDRNRSPGMRARPKLKSPQSGIASRRNSLTSPSEGNVKKLSHTQWAKEKGKESYDIMIENDKKGFVCVADMCYTLIGCRPDEHVLLLGPLQQLINLERNEMTDLKNSMRMKDSTTATLWATSLLNLEKEQASRRHDILEIMLRQLCLTTREALISFPTSQLLHITGKQQYFTTNIPPLTNDIKLPLPLPQVGIQWGLAKLLLDIGPDALLLILKLLLLERSVLVLGDDLQNVTACACALIELLKPFEWASAFIPVLPRKLLDFLNSPVPFVAGITVNDAARALEVEEDERTLDAMAQGMSLVNLISGTLHITPEKGVAKMLSIDPYLREQLTLLTNRVQLYCIDDSQSGLRNFQTFMRHGLKQHESLTLHSVCLALQQHFRRFCGDLATNGSAWNRYGTVDGDRFQFSADWFLSPIRADLSFHEAMVRTQLFLGYVDGCRQYEMDVKGIKTGELGKFLANWIYQKWTLKKQRRLQNNPA